MISQNVWQNLANPSYVLAPMAGITDMPFRLMCTEYGADLCYSEMASVAALQFRPQKTLAMLRSHPDEAPLIIQMFGSDVKQFAHAARLLSDEAKARSLGVPNYYKPQGLDINFGCPVFKVMKTGSGAMLFQDIAKSREIIQAVIANTDLPVSIKIRLQAGEVTAKQFLAAMADLPIAAVMVHGRSLAQGFAGPADFQAIKDLKNVYGGYIIANGGINNSATSKIALEESGSAAVGLARGVLGKPWLFAALKNQEFAISRKEVFAAILKHAGLVQADNQYFLEFRKHLCWYLNGLNGAKEMRAEAVKINNFEDVTKFVNKYQ
ncbi:MAG: tRNA-dihydrouridine synthase [Candidatus Falkowbacteria bacterium]